MHFCFSLPGFLVLVGWIPSRKLNELLFLEVELVLITLKLVGDHGVYQAPIPKPFQNKIESSIVLNLHIQKFVTHDWTLNSHHEGGWFPHRLVDNAWSKPVNDLILFWNCRPLQIHDASVLGLRLVFYFNDSKIRKRGWNNCF